MVTSRLPHSPVSRIATTNLAPRAYGHRKYQYCFIHSRIREAVSYRSSPFSKSLSRSGFRVAGMQTNPCSLIRGGASAYSTSAPQEPIVYSSFESTTGTWQYLVSDPSTSKAAIIDAVLDYDPATQAITTRTADKLLALAERGGYQIQWILETHAHADHLSAASYLQKQLAQTQQQRPVIGIGKRIGEVQKLFGRRYGVPPQEYAVVFDKLFNDDEVFAIGNLKAMAIHLPGHTPDHLGYKIGDNVFCGDSLFHADIGTARCDFPGGSARNLWNSARKLLAMPDHVKIWVGHDYPPEERKEPVAWLTVKEHREQNKHLKDGITEDEFIALRQQRDASLGAPRLLHQSLQINIRGGHLPKSNEAGHRLLHLPLKAPGLEF